MIPALLLLDDLSCPRRKKPLRYLSLCSGIEAATSAWHRLGWEPVAFCEIEKFPAAVLAYRYPRVPNLGDMTRWEEWSDDLLASVDILVGGTPCFTAGHMVLRSDGYVPLEQIRPGDQVVTHEGRLKKVLRTGSKLAKVGDMTLLGRPEGITCTADHPFLTVDWHIQNTRRQGKHARVEHCGTPEWTEASKTSGKSWCSLTAVSIPAPKESSANLTGASLLRMAGYYLGDGWTRRWSGKAKRAVCLGLNASKYETFLKDFPGLPHLKSEMRTSIRVTVCDTRLAAWLVENFGEKSYGKRIPSWVMSHEHRAEVLRGYEATDGHRLPSGKFSASTVSKALAYGVASLAETLGYTTSIKFCPMPETTVIEGRTVNQRSFWQTTWSKLDEFSKARIRHGYLIRNIKSFTPAGTQMVFNIEVEGDNSYVLNGAVVHNCQAFSVAGLRNSLNDTRGNLTLVFARIAGRIDAIRKARGLPPAIIVWENVPGVLTTRDNAFGCLLGALAGEDEAVVPAGKKWTNAGLVSGPERAVAWRVLDAQYFGVAQRRRRVFLVGSAREGFRPGEVLFEFDGVRRDSAPGRTSRQGPTYELAPCLAASGRGAARAGDTRGQDCVVPTWWDGGQVSQTLDAVLAKGQTMPEKNRFPAVLVPATAHTLRGEGFDASEDGTGRGTPLVPVAFVSGGHGALKESPVGDPVRATGGDTGGGGETIVAFSCKDHGGDAGDVSPTLRSMSHSGSHANAGGQVAVCFDTTQITSKDNRSNPRPGDPCHPLASGAHPPAIAGTLKANLGKRCGQADGSDAEHLLVPSMTAVRRLTPRECERLQGFPDDFTLIPWRGKPAAECPDGPRYKALGNSMAVPCMLWIGERIAKEVAR